MPTEHRFEDIDLREEPRVDRFEQTDEPTTTVYHYTKLSNCCTPTG